MIAALLFAGMAREYQGQPDWFKLSCQKLAQTYNKGLQFIVVMPAFQTLQQQTLNRIVKAKLADATDKGVVIPSLWASKVRSCKGI